jgi:hypothetical protein
VVDFELMFVCQVPDSISFYLSTDVMIGYAAPLYALQENFKGTTEKRGLPILACPQGFCYCCIQTLVKMSDDEDGLFCGFVACEIAFIVLEKEKIATELHFYGMHVYAVIVPQFWLVVRGLEPV